MAEILAEMYINVNVIGHCLYTTTHYYFDNKGFIWETFSRIVHPVTQLWKEERKMINCLVLLREYPWLERFCKQMGLEAGKTACLAKAICPAILTQEVDINFKRRDRKYILVDRQGNIIGVVGYQDDHDIKIRSRLSKLMDPFNQSEEIELEKIKQAILRVDRPLRTIGYVIEIASSKKGIWANVLGQRNVHTVTIFFCPDDKNWADLLLITRWEHNQDRSPLAESSAGAVIFLHAIAFLFQTY